MAHDTNKPLQLTLSVAEINQVLEALGRQPYARVFQLIGRIQQQAAAQISASETTAPAGPAHS
ncbi:hypothetical protein CYFUS_006851 [Cystobacter fuscus]|uniref:Uncharacterized protein n=1 Tax=Cystobacter fuscus TaxID=43 RepID=A0A250JBX1_9BACT|nr:hypothetical protein [Cystobacter fuscus]ATB41385.1 hypothetical protein CYFUS_006851 [Cystobacter fuscus]